MLAGGVLAAVVSFLQVAFMIGIYLHAGQHGSAGGTRTLFNAIINEGRLIPAGGHHVRLYEEGAGSPAVVIIAGAGDCADSWVPITTS